MSQLSSHWCPFSQHEAEQVEPVLDHLDGNSICHACLDQLGQRVDAIKANRTQRVFELRLAQMRLYIRSVQCIAYDSNDIVVGVGLWTHEHPTAIITSPHVFHCNIDRFVFSKVSDEREDHELELRRPFVNWSFSGQLAIVTFNSDDRNRQVLLDLLEEPARKALQRPALCLPLKHPLMHDLEFKVMKDMRMLLAVEGHSMCYFFDQNNEITGMKLSADSVSLDLTEEVRINLAQALLRLPAHRGVSKSCKQLLERWLVGEEHDEVLTDAE